MQKSETKSWRGLPQSHVPRSGTWRPRGKFPRILGPVDGRPTALHAQSLCADRSEPATEVSPQSPLWDTCSEGSALRRLTLWLVLRFHATFSLNGNPGSLGRTPRQAGILQSSYLGAPQTLCWVYKEISIALTKKMWKSHLRTKNSWRKKNLKEYPSVKNLYYTLLIIKGKKRERRKKMARKHFKMLT